MNTLNERMNNITRALIATIRDDLDNHEKRVKQMEQDVCSKSANYRIGVSFRAVKP